MHLPHHQAVHEARLGSPQYEARLHLAAGNRWQAAREMYRQLESCVAFAVLFNGSWDESSRELRKLTIRRAAAWLVQHGSATARERFLVVRAQRLLLAVLNRVEATPVDLHDVLDIFAELQYIADSADDNDNSQEAKA